MAAMNNPTSSQRVAELRKQFQEKKEAEEKEA